MWKSIFLLIILGEFSALLEKNWLNWLGKISLLLLFKSVLLIGLISLLFCILFIKFILLLLLLKFQALLELMLLKDKFAKLQFGKFLLRMKLLLLAECKEFQDWKELKEWKELLELKLLDELFETSDSCDFFLCNSILFFPKSEPRLFDYMFSKILVHLLIKFLLSVYLSKHFLLLFVIFTL